MIKTFLKEYGDFLRKNVKLKKPMRIVFDCSNGYAGEVLKETLKATNIQPIYLNALPLGNFPGHGPNPSAPHALDELKKEVIAKKADLGIIFDGDGDRAIFIDDKGREIDSDDLIKFYIEEKNTKAMVCDIRIGWSVRENKKIKIFRTKVGNYYIKKKMIEKRINFGAERAGHYYFKIKGAYIDGAIKMAIDIVSLISRHKETISQIIDNYPKKYFRISEKNYFIKNKEAAIEAIKKVYIRKKPKIIKIDGLTMEFKDMWFNVRPSANENLLRLNMEARSEAILQRELKVITSLIKEK